MHMCEEDYHADEAGDGYYIDGYRRFLAYIDLALCDMIDGSQGLLLFVSVCACVS